MTEVEKIVISADYKASFVDRTDERAMFDNTYDSITSSTCETIYISGMPGVGKSRLAEEFKCMLESRGKIKEFLELDFYRNIMESYEYLEWMAEQLHGNNGVVFPLFSYALIVYYIKRNKKDRSDEEKISSLKHKHKFIYDYLDNAFDVSSLIPKVGAVTGAVGSSLNRMVYLVEDSLRKKYQKKRLPDNYSDVLNGDYKVIEKNLPLFWAEDVSEYTKNLDNPFVFFLDTFEAYISELNLNGDDRERDFWLVDKRWGIMRRIPNAIWIISGRDELYEHEDFIKKIRLECLEEKWRKTILEDANIPPNLSRFIVNESKGLPLHIELCIDTYLELTSSGKEPLERDFEGTYEQLLTRYIRYMNDKKEILDVVYLLSLIGKWNETTILDEIKDCGVAFSLSAYDTVKGLSFIIPAGNNCYEVHSVARKIFLSDCPSIIKSAYEHRLQNLMADNKLSPQEEYEVFSEIIDNDLESRENDNISESVIAEFEKNQQYLEELLGRYQYEQFNRTYSRIISVINIENIDEYLCDDQSTNEKYVDMIRMGITYFDQTEQNTKAYNYQKIIVRIFEESRVTCEKRDMLWEKYCLASSLLYVPDKNKFNRIKELYEECVNELGENDEITIKVENLLIGSDPNSDPGYVIDFVDNQKQLYGEDSPRGIKAEMNLALAYKRAGDLNMAIKKGKETCHKMGLFLSESDTDYINAQHNLVIAYLALAESQLNSNIKYDKKKRSRETLMSAKRINLIICNTIETKDVELREDPFSYYYTLVHIMVLLKEFEETKPYCLKLLDIADKHPQPASQMELVFDTMATISIKERQWEAAFNYMEKLADICEKIEGANCLRAQEVRYNIKLYKSMNNIK